MRSNILGIMSLTTCPDDRDMYRQQCKLCGQANMLVCKFSMCSSHVRIALLLHIFGATKKKSLQSLTVAYNDSWRILLKVLRFCSTSEVFITCGVRCCVITIRCCIYSFMCRTVNLSNQIIQALVQEFPIFFLP
ncbi:hypothetical protein NL108_009572 [Boleophthalmus pectinirostris]|nr:hypothetical protein NL108_009572 [Boleophthalmus pectinirostris]